MLQAGSTALSLRSRFTTKSGPRWTESSALTFASKLPQPALSLRSTKSGITAIAKPEDLKGLKLRTPLGPIWVSMFKALDAPPTPLNFTKVYLALQSKVVDGQENPLAIISTAKLNEVQKFCSLTGHMWDCYWFMGNKKIFERLPPDLQVIMTKNVAASALLQRSDVFKLNNGLQADLKAKGMLINDAPADPFCVKLRAAGFYSDWHKKFGDEPWTLLENTLENFVDLGSGRRTYTRLRQASRVGRLT